MTIIGKNVLDKGIAAGISSHWLNSRLMPPQKRLKVGCLRWAVSPLFRGR